MFTHEVTYMGLAFGKIEINTITLHNRSTIRPSLILFVT